LNLATLRTLGIEGRVYAGHLAIVPDRLGAGVAPRRYAEFSLFPAAWRDFALVVDAGVTAAEVRESLARAAHAATGAAFAVESVEVFDVYQGEGLPKGKKSLAFGLVFRALDRTLTDEEVNAACRQIQGAITADGRIELRA